MEWSTIKRKEYNIIGYLPEERGLYPKITIEDQLIYFASLRGKLKRIEPKIDFWMEKFQVKGKTDKVKSLSKEINKSSIDCDTYS